MKALLFPVCLAALALGSCAHNTVVHGSGQPVQVSMSTTGIKHIEMSGIGTLELLPSSASQSLRIQGDDNLVERLQIERQGDTLVIKPNNRFPSTWVASTPLVFSLNHNVSSVSISGSADLIADQLVQPNFALAISGSGQAQLGLAVEQAELAISGSGRIYADGQAQQLALNVTGSGQLYAARLDGSDANVNLVGAARVEIGRYDDMAVSAMGAAKVYYAGEPELARTLVGSAVIVPIH